MRRLAEGKLPEPLRIAVEELAPALSRVCLQHNEGHTVHTAKCEGLARARGVDLIRHHAVQELRLTIRRHLDALPALLGYRELDIRVVVLRGQPHGEVDGVPGLAPRPVPAHLGRLALRAVVVHVAVVAEVLIVHEPLVGAPLE